jgi:hypothetical protein
LSTRFELAAFALCASLTMTGFVVPAVVPRDR